MFDAPTSLGGVSLQALGNFWPRSRETEYQIWDVEPLNTDHIAYTWSWNAVPRRWLTAIHCLSSTCPSVFEDALGLRAR